MPRSEIDDIFAGKSKGKGKSAVASTPSASNSVAPALEVKKKKKSKKRKRADGVGEDGDAEEITSLVPVLPQPSKKNKVPETIIDPSLPSAPSKPPPTTTASSSKKKKTTTSSVQNDDGFADSRGTGPRKRTEEGWSVFKEAELGIDVEAGGTCDLYSQGWCTVVIGGSQGHLCVRLIAIVVSAVFQHGEVWVKLISYFQVFDMHVHINNRLLLFHQLTVDAYWSIPTGPFEALAV